MDHQSSFRPNSIVNNFGKQQQLHKQPQFGQSNKQSAFVDQSPYFNDLNASFKRLYKSIVDNRDVYESGKYIK